MAEITNDAGRPIIQEAKRLDAERILSPRTWDWTPKYGVTIPEDAKSVRV